MRNTVAILGDSPVICHAIAHLVEPGGYETRIFDTAQEEAALTGVDVVLVTAGVDSSNWRSPGCAEVVPVIWLVDTPEEKEALVGRGILWPCTAKELQDSVSAAISPDASKRPV